MTAHTDTNKRGRARGIGACCSAPLIIAVILAIWWTNAQSIPEISIPTPAMPNPNAYDTFKAASASMLDSTKVGYAMSSTGKHDSAIKEDREYSWQEKQKFVSENASTLTMLRKGLKQEYMSPPARSFATLFPEFAKDRAMARLVVLESAVRAHRRDYRGSMDSRLDALELGATVPRGGVLIAGLVGLACEAIGRRPMWRDMDRLDAAAARVGAQRLAEIRKKEVPFSSVMQEESWCCQASLLEIMKQPNFAKAFHQAYQTQSTDANGPEPEIPEFISQLGFLVYSKRRIMNDYTSYMKQVIDNGKQPYSMSENIPLPNDPFVQAIAPTFSEARLKFAERDAQSGLLELSLALRAYMIEHGRYPTALTELTTSIIDVVPLDPYAKSGTFRYRITGKSYLLYSVGPDGKDDGGKMIDSGPSRDANPNSRYYVRANSVGDIVAGKNVW